MMRVVAIFLFFVLVTFQANAQESKHKILDKVTFQDSLNQHSILLIDVRTPEEFKAGHIKHAKNINFLNPEFFKAEIEKIDKSKPVYIYCRSGNRSNKAALKMQEFGFEKIYDLDGGYLKWTAEE